MFFSCLETMQSRRAHTHHPNQAGSAPARVNLCMPGGAKYTPAASSPFVVEQRRNRKPMKVMTDAHTSA